MFFDVIYFCESILECVELWLYNEKELINNVNLKLYNMAIYIEDSDNQNKIMFMRVLD